MGLYEQALSEASKIDIGIEWKVEEDRTYTIREKIKIKLLKEYRTGFWKMCFLWSVGLIIQFIFDTPWNSRSMIEFNCVYASMVLILFTILSVIFFRRYFYIKSTQFGSFFINNDGFFTGYSYKSLSEFDSKWKIEDVDLESNVFVLSVYSKIQAQPGTSFEEDFIIPYNKEDEDKIIECFTGWVGEGLALVPNYNKNKSPFDKIVAR